MPRALRIVARSGHIGPTFFRPLLASHLDLGIIPRHNRATGGNLGRENAVVLSVKSDLGYVDSSP